MRLPLTLAHSATDRVAALANGQFAPEGLDLTVVRLPVEEIFFRMLKYGEFDAAEMSLSSYVASVEQRPGEYIALPTFPSRAFRHGCIFVSRDADVSEPRDLAGRRVGVPEYEMTAAVWIRGILGDEYGLDPVSPVYVTGGLEQPGRYAKTKLELPDSVHIEEAAPGATLSEMLAAGDLDALYTARMPSSFIDRPDRVRRMFPDYRQREIEYFRTTQIFPIMHTVVIRREVYERNRWIAMELLKSLSQSRRHALSSLYESVALPVMLPWLTQHIESTREVMGDDYWPDGLDPNAHVLVKFLDYARSQCIVTTDIVPDMLFAPECLEDTRV